MDFSQTYGTYRAPKGTYLCFPWTCSMTELGGFHGAETVGEVKAKLDALNITTLQACIANTTSEKVSKTLEEAGMKLIGKYIGNGNIPVFTHLYIKPERVAA